MTTGRSIATLLAPALALAAIAVPAHAQQPARKVGDTIQIRVDDLPPPEETPAGFNKAVPAPRPPGAALKVPSGFKATLFRDGVEHARSLLALPDGSVLVAQQKPGTLTLLRDADGDGTAEDASLWAGGFERPFGLAFHKGFVYVGDLQGVWRLPWRDGGTAAAGERKRITPPGALGDGNGHDTRTLAIAPDGKHLYVGVGSAADLAEGEEPTRATIQEFTMDGAEPRTLASGLRNPVGIAFRPGSSDLYAVVNERERMGDGLVPDFMTRIQPGGFYGWPYAYLGPHPQPGLGDRRPDLVGQTLTPDLLFEAHSAPLGLVFTDRLKGPERFRNGALVALHGSSSRAAPVGYTVVFVPFADGKPTGGYDVFASGFQVPSDDGQPHVWGRPSGLAIDRDGTLFIADDWGTVWRVAYREPQKEAHRKKERKRS